MKSGYSDRLFNSKSINHSPPAFSYNGSVAASPLPFFVDFKPDQVSTTQIEKYYRNKHSGCLPRYRISNQLGQWNQRDYRNALDVALNDCLLTHGHWTQEDFRPPDKRCSRNTIQKSLTENLSHNKGDSSNQHNICPGVKLDDQTRKICHHIQKVHITVCDLDDVTKDDDTWAQIYSKPSHCDELYQNSSPKKFIPFERSMLLKPSEGLCTETFGNANGRPFHVLNCSKSTYCEDTPINGDFQHNNKGTTSETVAPTSEMPSEEMETGSSFPRSNATVGRRIPVPHLPADGKHCIGQRSGKLTERHLSAMLKSGDSLQVKQLYQHKPLAGGQSWLRQTENLNYMLRPCLFGQSHDAQILRRVVRLDKANRGNLAQLPVGHVDTQGRASREVAVSKVAVASNYHAHELANPYTRQLYALNQSSEVQQELIVGVEHNLVRGSLAHPSVSLSVEYPFVEPLLEIRQSFTELAMKVPTYRAKHCGVQTTLTATSIGGDNFHRKEKIVSNQLAQLHLRVKDTFTPESTEVTNFETKKNVKEMNTTAEQRNFPVLLVSQMCEEGDDQMKESKRDDTLNPSPPGVKMSSKYKKWTCASQNMSEMADCNTSSLRWSAEQHTIPSEERFGNRLQRVISSTGNKESEKKEGETGLSVLSQNTRNGTEELNCLKRVFKTDVHSFESNRIKRHEKRDSIISSPIRFPSLDITHEFRHPITARKDNPRYNIGSEKNDTINLDCVEYNICMSVYNTKLPTSMDGRGSTEKSNKAPRETCEPLNKTTAEFTASMELSSKRNQINISKARPSDNITSTESRNSFKRLSEGTDIIHEMAKNDGQGGFITRRRNMRTLEKSPSVLTVSSSIQKAKCALNSPAYGNDTSNEMTDCWKIFSLPEYPSLNMTGSTSPPHQPKQSLESKLRTDLLGVAVRRPSSSSEAEPVDIVIQELKMSECFNETTVVIPQNIHHANVLQRDKKKCRQVHFPTEHPVIARSMRLGSSLFLEALPNTKRSTETCFCVTPSLTKYYSLNTSEYKNPEGVCEVEAEHYWPTDGLLKGKCAEMRLNSEDDAFDYSCDLSLDQGSQTSGCSSVTTLFSNLTSPTILKAVDEHVFDTVQSTLHKTSFFSLNNLVSGIPNSTREMHSASSPTGSTSYMISNSESMTKYFLPSSSLSISSKILSNESAPISPMSGLSTVCGKQSDFEYEPWEVTHVIRACYSPKVHEVHLEKCSGHEGVSQTGRISALPYEPHKQPSRLRSLWCCTPWKYDRYKLSP